MAQYAYVHVNHVQIITEALCLAYTALAHSYWAKFPLRVWMRMPNPLTLPTTAAI